MTGEPKHVCVDFETTEAPYPESKSALKGVTRSWDLVTQTKVDAAALLNIGAFSGSNTFEFLRETRSQPITPMFSRTSVWKPRQ